MRLLVIALALAGPAWASLPARALELEANVLADIADPSPGDGICDVDPAAEGEQCTLRAAIQTANALEGPDVVQLVAGKYKLRLRGAGEDQAARGDLDVTDDLVVAGQGAGVTIVDARKLKHRIFDVFASLELVNVTLQKGKAGKGDDDDDGGCIRSSGDLAVFDSEILRCKAKDDGGGVAVEAGTAAFQDVLFDKNRAADDGGALAIEGDTTLNRVTASRNRAQSGGAADVSDGSLAVINSTISKNRAREGGGLRADEGTTIEVTQSTLAFNKARKGAAIASESVTTLVNTIVHAKKRAACHGTIVSGGGNLVSDTSCGLGLASDQRGVDPRLAKKLADNGGATPTHALLPGSPAIDAGLDADCRPSDQRGELRVDFPSVGVGDTLCDVGAFEATP